jgi:uncharacterized membrane protein
MSVAEFGLALSVFLACAVEAVEALTIVLAVGTTRDWPSALAGVGAAALALAAIIAVMGVTLDGLPLDALRVVIGLLLLGFGVQWLRKAILRAAGLKALRDEDAAYQREQDAARTVERMRDSFDRYSFAVAFKGVLLEGLEVAVIVVTLGADKHRLGLAAAAAGAAVVVVIGAGVAVRAPLARVPENAMKFAVGIMLTSFGTFWTAEGAGVAWPGGEVFLLAIIATVLALSAAGVLMLRPAGPPPRSS